MKRVVITGMGLVTPLGVGVKHVWERLKKGESGLKAIDTFDVSGIASKIAGCVPVGAYADGGFDINEWIPAKDQKKMDLFIAYALCAAAQAMEDAGWCPSNEEDREGAGVLIGSGIGGLQGIYENSVALKERGARRVNPFFIPSSLINLASGHVSIKYGFKGPNHAVVTACSSGSHAIGDAARIIRCGDAKVMLAGGAESAVCPIGVAGFAAMRALSTAFNDSPQKASRPWDRDRDGFVIGEGAGLVVLEDYEHAKKRGARVYAEVVGYGMSGDAYHITAPSEDGDGAYRAMKLALKSAGIEPHEIDYINAHGTSTPVGDVIELTAVQRLFAGNKKPLMSSTKSSIGHLLGAAGSVEAIFSILALNDGIAPPTLNLDHPVSGAEIDLVPHKAKESKIKSVLSNSFGFGGTNASLVFKKV